MNTDGLAIGRRRRSTCTISLLAAAAAALAACDSRVTTAEPPVASMDAELRRSLAQWGVVPIRPMAAQEPAHVELGRALFFDKLLSGNRDVACATCHSPARSLSDGFSLAVGTGAATIEAMRTPGPGRSVLPRRAPSLLNSGLGAFYLFWDARLAGFGQGQFHSAEGLTLPAGLPNALAAQAMLPILDRREMRGHPGDVDVLGATNELAAYADDEPEAVWDAVMRRLLAVPGYVQMFDAAFAGTPRHALGFQHAARALAAFQMAEFTRTQSPFDAYLERDDRALSVPQKRGALLFFGRAQCGSCHSGPLLGGTSFTNVGAPQVGPGGRKAPPLDLGVGEFIDQEFYRFAFRVPPLRNVELRAPFMHSGAYRTLEAVVRHYDDARKALREYDVTQLAPELRPLHHGDAATVEQVLATLDFRLREPLNLSEQEVADLVAFLEALTDPAARDLASLVPASVPSGLPVPR